MQAGAPVQVPRLPDSQHKERSPAAQKDEAGRCNSQRRADIGVVSEGQVAIHPAPHSQSCQRSV